MQKLTVISLTNKLSDWSFLACEEYSKRLKPAFALNIIDIPLKKRTNTSNIAQILEKEAQLMQQAVPENSYLIALDLTGKSFTSETLANKFDKLSQITNHLCFLIGGPEGLSSLLKTKCREIWSLSPLTLPHQLAKIIFLETTYRCWCINKSHPYHK